MGDALMSYTPEAILKVGLWDERFQSIYFHKVEFQCCAAELMPSRVSFNMPFSGPSVPFSKSCGEGGASGCESCSERG